MQWPQDRSATRVFGDDRAWFAEHHFSRYGIDPAIHLTVANVAARTSRIRLGTAVTVIPFIPPIRAAEELATLDILFRAWQEGPFAHEGEHWRFEPVDIFPKPVQHPRIPTYIAAISPESVRW